MNHSFNVQIAEQLGIEEAVILENIFFWVKNNQANKRNFKVGKYWTFNSISAMKEQFPYMTANKINYALKNLINAGYIEKGCFNDNGYDRTSWFTVTDITVAIYENSQMDFGKFTNGFMNNQKSNCENSQIIITDINTDIKTDINSNINSSPSNEGGEKKETGSQRVITDKYCEVYQSIYGKKFEPVAKDYWSRTSHFLKSQLNRFTVEQLCSAIDMAKNEKWLKDRGFDLQLILSNNMVERLLNPACQKSGNNQRADSYDWDKIN